MVDITNIPEDHPLKIIIGAGEQRWEGWIPTQGKDLNLLVRKDWEDTFHSREADAFLCEHVWEHLTLEEAYQAAQLCYEYLKSGGFLRCAVPDGNFPDPEYQRLAQVGGPGPKDHPAASHKVLYTYKTFVPVFEQAGFKIDLLEYCDETGRFHYNQWNLDAGPIYRSLMLDHRNRDGKIGCVSLIIDAIKPED